MKFCILGAGGAFGLTTTRYLLDQGHEVLGIGRSALRPDYFSLGAARWQGFTYHHRHIWYEMDYVLGLLRHYKPEIIVNFAAQGEGAASWHDAWRFFQINSMALSMLVERLHESHDYLKHFIHIGSSEVYGSVNHPVDESAPIRPSSPYSASKAAFDLYLLAMAKHRQFPTTILRPCNAYCPGQALHRVIPKAIVAGLTGRAIDLHGGGRAEKSYIHARDLAKAICLVAERKPMGTVYNVGSRNPIRVRDVVELCAQALGLRLEELARETVERIGQDSRYWLDSSLIHQDTGWTPTILWEEGLDEMVAWGRKYLPYLRDLSTDYVMRG